MDYSYKDLYRNTYFAKFSKWAKDLTYEEAVEVGIAKPLSPPESPQPTPKRSTAVKSRKSTTNRKQESENKE